MDRMNKLPEFWVKKYFIKVTENAYQIAPEIKNEVIFRSFNLMENNFIFTIKFHIIFCRNVMIYFDMQTRDDLVRRFYDLTAPGGYLFVGHTESLPKSCGYQYIMPAVYRKP
jgi:chemotaxis protein methyltransferase CheR